MEPWWRLMILLLGIFHSIAQQLLQLLEGGSRSGRAALGGLRGADEVGQLEGVGALEVCAGHGFELCECLGVFFGVAGAGAIGRNVNVEAAHVGVVGRGGDATVRGEAGEDEGLDLEVLEKDYQVARSTNHRLPPGWHTHLASLYYRIGKPDQARQELVTEKAEFPESARFVHRLIANLKNPG